MTEPFENGRTDGSQRRGRRLRAPFVTIAARLVEAQR